MINTSFIFLVIPRIWESGEGHVKQNVQFQRKMKLFKMEKRKNLIKGLKCAETVFSFFSGYQYIGLSLENKVYWVVEQGDMVSYSFCKSRIIKSLKWERRAWRIMPLLETEAIISQYLKFCFFVKMQFKCWVLREVLLLLWRAYLISLLYSLRIGLKCLPGMWETQVQSLGWEDPLEKEIATHSSTLAWRIPWREETKDQATRVSPGNLLEMQILRFFPDCLRQKLRGWDPTVC